MPKKSKAVWLRAGPHSESGQGLSSAAASSLFSPVTWGTSGRPPKTWVPLPGSRSLFPACMPLDGGPASGPGTQPAEQSSVTGGRGGPAHHAHVYLMMSIIPVLSLERSKQLLGAGNSPESWVVGLPHTPAWLKSSTHALYLQRHNCYRLPHALDSQLCSSECFCSFPQSNSTAILREHSRPLHLWPEVTGNVSSYLVLREKPSCHPRRVTRASCRPFPPQQLGLVFRGEYQPGASAAPGQPSWDCPTSGPGQTLPFPSHSRFGPGQGPRPHLLSNGQVRCCPHLPTLPGNRVRV